MENTNGQEHLKYIRATTGYEIKAPAQLPGRILKKRAEDLILCPFSFNKVKLKINESIVINFLNSSDQRLTVN